MRALQAECLVALGLTLAACGPLSHERRIEKALDQAFCPSDLRAKVERYDTAEHMVERLKTNYGITLGCGSTAYAVVEGVDYTSEAAAGRAARRFLQGGSDEEVSVWLFRDGTFLLNIDGGIETEPGNALAQALVDQGYQRVGGT